MDIRVESDHGAADPNTRRKSEILVLAVLLADGMTALRAGTSAAPESSVHFITGLSYNKPSEELFSSEISSDKLQFI